MNLTRELVAASATPLVLAVLKRGDSYGYEIIRSIRDLSGGELEWKEGMLYPLLHRLEEQGLVESYGGSSPTGRARKYYRLLVAGAQQLEKHTTSFDLIRATLARLQQPDIGGAHVTA
jgi:PadR family transcriptional regulator, regulatory protein PadR